MIDFEAYEKWYNAHIIWWRRTINKYFEKEYGFTIKFYPEIEGEDNE